MSPGDAAPARSVILRSELRYAHPVGVWIAPGIDSVSAGDVVDSANTARTDPYTLLNLRLGYDSTPWQLGVVFEARNLTETRDVSAVTVDDAHGRFFAPGAGRAFYGTVSWRGKSCGTGAGGLSSCACPGWYGRLS